MARIFKVILDQFLEASGGEVNSWKCYIYAWNNKAQILANIANIIHYPIKINGRSFKNLEILTCLSFVPVDDWVIITSKIKANME